MDVMDVVETAIGGLDIDTTIEGRERYRINVRYPRELRDSAEDLARVLVPVPFQGAGTDGGPSMAAGRTAYVRLGQLGAIQAAMGPPMIKDEGGQLAGWVYVDTSRSDLGGYVADAKAAVARELSLPSGYFLKWTGQYEF